MCTQEYWNNLVLEAAAAKYGATVSDILANINGSPSLWWMRPKEPANLNLTRSGYDYFTVGAGLKSHEFVYKETFTGRQMLQLSRVFPSPFCVINQHRIALFGEQDVIMLAMSDNNLSRYLDNLS